MTNIDQNNIKRRKKQPYNIELICLIYNKYKIISQKKEGGEKQGHGGESFPSDGEKHFTPER